jgi:RimJ/RimL family protein N-acetyltransferase
VEPVSYSDGRLTIRRLGVRDLEADLEAKDDEQIDWLWEPGHRESWEAMSPDAQREHARRTLQAAQDAFGPGPKWIFAVDTSTDEYVAYVDCDLANDKVPAGQANICYSAHPSHRGHGYVSGAVRLAARFLAEHTAADEAHIVVDSENLASLRVARSVGAPPTEKWTNEQGRVMIRHVLALRRGDPCDPRGGRRD